jgi:hypothetical protein
VALAGSRARKTEVPSIDAHSRSCARRLLARGVLAVDGEQLLFKQDSRFSSPSMAAGGWVGSAGNGRKAWRSADGQMLKEIRAARAAG